MSKFIENVGRGSTTASLDGRGLGYNVNASAFENGDNSITVKLMSNASYARGIPQKHFDSIEDYEAWKDECPDNTPMWLYGIESFGCVTAF